MNDAQKESEFDAAIARIDAQTAEAPKVSIVGYLFWSLAIPPFTTFWVMYSAWKKGVLHRLMPDMAIVYSILFALWSLLMFSAPGAFASYFSQEAKGVATLDKVEALTLVLGGILSGIYLRVKAKKEGSLSFFFVGLLTLILILQFFVGWHQLSFISAMANSVQDTNLGL